MQCVISTLVALTILYPTLLAAQQSDEPQIPPDIDVDQELTTLTPEEMRELHLPSPSIGENEGPAAADVRTAFERQLDNAVKDTLRVLQHSSWVRIWPDGARVDVVGHPPNLYRLYIYVFADTWGRELAFERATLRIVNNDGLIQTGRGHLSVTEARFRCRDCGGVAEKQVRAPVPRVGGAVGYIAHQHASS